MSETTKLLYQVVSIVMVIAGVGSLITGNFLYAMLFFIYSDIVDIKIKVNA